MVPFVKERVIWAGREEESICAMFSMEKVFHKFTVSVSPRRGRAAAGEVDLFSFSENEAGS